VIKSKNIKHAEYIAHIGRGEIHKPKKFYCIKCRNHLAEVDVMGVFFVNGLNPSWAAIIWLVLKQFVSTKYLSEFIRRESLHYCKMLLIFALMYCLHNIFTKMWIPSCLSF